MYHDLLGKRENDIYFAGEHTELTHAWIDTAAKSGIRAAAEVHCDDDFSEKPPPPLNQPQEDDVLQGNENNQRGLVPPDPGQVVNGVPGQGPQIEWFFM